MLMKRSNLFENLPSDLSEEQIEVLTMTGGVRIERIVSRGQATPEGQWYDQPAMEWVVLLSGAAVLRFEEEEDPIEMKPGDWIEIPPHCRHRVESTRVGTETIWLAVHGEPQD